MRHVHAVWIAQCERTQSEHSQAKRTPKSGELDEQAGKEPTGYDPLPAQLVHSARPYALLTFGSPQVHGKFTPGSRERSLDRLTAFCAISGT